MPHYLPDPEPGRCKNLRPGPSPYDAARRCKLTEDKPHVCEFDAPGPDQVPCVTPNSTPMPMWDSTGWRYNPGPWSDLAPLTITYVGDPDATFFAAVA